MPYIPSRKTNGKSTDREVLDAAVNVLAEELASKVTNNLHLIKVYESIFYNISWALQRLFIGKQDMASGTTRFITCCNVVALHIYEIGKRYDYEGAFLGELNYAVTRLIQRVPQIMVEKGVWKDELRYWLYAATVEALTYTAYRAGDSGMGISGVFEDIKDEYKRRVNVSYEAWQILKSGDCYDTPYYTRLVKVVDEDGNLIGYQEVMLKRSEATLRQDVLEGQLVLRKRGASNG